MAKSQLNKPRIIEIALTIGVVLGIALVLFPGIWKPLLGPGDIETPPRNDTTNLQVLDPATENAEIPKPHWVDNHATITQLDSGASGFRTSFKTNGDFQLRETVQTEDLPELPMIEEQAPHPPQEDWEIIELLPETADSAWSAPGTVDVPQILPAEISDEVVGEMKPSLTRPEFPGQLNLPQQHHGDSIFGSFSPEPRWWVDSVQQSQLANRTPEPINLDQVILMALQQAPTVQVLNTQPEVQRTVIDQSIAAFDWATFVETIWTDINEPVGSLLTTGRSGGRFLQQEFSVEGGLKKKLATGGDLRVGQSFGHLDNNSNFLDPQDQEISRLVIDYRQPLMRGAGQRYATTQIVLAKLDFEQATNQSLSTLQQYIVEVVAAYWDLHRARVALVQNRRSLERAQELIRSLPSVSGDQRVRAEAAISNRQTEVLKAEYEVLNAQDRLVSLTMGPKSEQTQFAELIPEPLDVPMDFSTNTEALTYVALRNRPEVGQAIAKIKSASALEYVATNELLPKLDAILSTYVAGLRGGGTGTSAFEQQFSAGDPSYSIGFGFELPVGNRAAKSRLQRQQLQTSISSQEFQKTVGDVVLDVRIASRATERLQQEIRNNHLALDKAKQALQLIRQRQQQATASEATAGLFVEDVLAAQTRLNLAEKRLLSSQTEYAVALIDLKRATGELVNGKFRADQYMSQPMGMNGDSTLISAPTQQPNWPPTPLSTQLLSGPIPPVPFDSSPPRNNDFRPADRLESIEITPEVIEWNSEEE